MGFAKKSRIYADNCLPWAMGYNRVAQVLGVGGINWKQAPDNTSPAAP